MKLRLARKICNIEVNGHFNNKWFANNKRGKECSPWRVVTRKKAAFLLWLRVKRISPARRMKLLNRRYT